ncbi:MAG: TonB family protein [Sphingomonas sp.]|uniref:energy transducer TonB n=1 Tax=Sphingomonas sp. TaxID=28214 RepID=UPI0017D3FA43|nr:TonB family protein [Sphingomonas sp.]MBA3666321.1 TonB family protein [Sphingomonas sp.]
MAQLAAEPRDRIKSALGVALVHALAGLALVRGLGFTIDEHPADVERLIDVALDPPPPPVRPAAPDTEERKIARPKDAEGAASPANKKDTPTEVVAPIPMIPLPLPLPISVAKVAGQGTAPAVGAAQLPGPGTGAGGIGNGLGSGLSGNGAGGGGGGLGARARYLSGGIDPDDYPGGAYRRRAQGTTYIRFAVLPNGRVRDCRVTRSSGHRDLDSATCPLLERSLRYRPARDALGRAVAETVNGQQDWVLGPEPPAVEYDAEVVDEPR